MTGEPEVRTVLRDGTKVLLRPIGPGDKDGLRDGMRRLSADSARLRFLHPMSRLSDDQLRYLTEIDHHDHMAWVAADISGAAPLGIGVARYIRDGDRPDTAEMAITIVDSHQGRGLGALLFAALARSAARNGIRTLTAEVLRENTRAVDLLKRLGGATTSLDESTAHIEVPVAATRISGEQTAAAN